MWDFVRVMWECVRVVWDVLRAACAKGCLAWWLAHFWDFVFFWILSVMGACGFVRIKSGFFIFYGSMLGCFVVFCWCVSGLVLGWVGVCLVLE